MNGSMTMLFLYAFVIVAGATNGIASSQLATNSSEIGIGLPTTSLGWERLDTVNDRNGNRQNEVAGSRIWGIKNRSRTGWR